MNKVILPDSTPLFQLSAVEYPSTSVSLPLTPAQKEKKR